MHIVRQDDYTIVPYMKPEARRILSVTNSTKRRKSLKEWLDKQEMSTQILYGLLTLAIASDRLALDKYGVFYICKIPRSRRSTAVRILEGQISKYLSKEEGTIDSTHQKAINSQLHNYGHTYHFNLPSAA